MSAMNSSSRWLSVLGAGSLVCAGYFVAGAHAEGPPGSSPLFYAGTLEDDGALAEGSLPIGVAIFDDADPAPPESRLCDIPSTNRSVSRGRFRIDVSACVDAVSDNPDVFVEVTVRGVPLPRQKLGAVPYALEAQRAQTAAVAEAVAGGAVDAAALANNSVSATAIAAAAVGSSEVADGSLGGIDVADGSIGVGDLGDGSVGAFEIIDGSVGVADLGDGSVGAFEIIDGSVGVADLGDGSVGAFEIIDGSVGVADLGDNSVGAFEIVDGSVGAAELGDGSVGAFELQGGALAGHIRVTNNCSPNSTFPEFRDCVCNSNEFAVGGGGDCDILAVSRSGVLTGAANLWLVGGRSRTTGAASVCTNTFAVCLRVAQ